MKKQVVIALCTAAGLMAPAATVLTSPVIAHAASYPLLHYGSRGGAVKTLQSKLQAQGYSVGAIDGIYGSRTAATVRKFQAAHHLQVDGIAGPSTFRVLDAVHVAGGKTAQRPPTPKPSAAPLSSLPTSQLVRYGSRGYAVKVVQTAMNHLGFHCGTVDGIYGSMTSHAIRSFQSAHHLHVDGIVGPNTWRVIKNALDGTKPTTSKPANPPASTSSSKSSGGSSTTSSQPSKPYPGHLIRYGSRGSAVKEVQTQLNHLGYHCGPDDGIYGPETYAAIRKFQAAHHLHIDGIVGPNSWPKLFPPAPTAPKQSTSGSQTTSRGTDPLTTFYAYDSSNHKIGTYSSQADAEKALGTDAGGYIKDAGGAIVWRQGNYTAYDKAGKLLGHFVTEDQAKQKIQNVPGGKVYNEQTSKTLVYVSPDYLAYDASGKLVVETTSLNTAKADIAKDPLGTVKDANQGNKVVYTQPDVYAAYRSPNGSPEDTTSLQTAKSYSQATTTGFVIDLGHHSLVQNAQDYFYLSSSNHWMHHLQGVTIYTGSSRPSWAKQGEIYVALDSSSPPYYYDFYQVSHVSAPSHKGTFENPFRTADLRYNAPSTITADAIDKWFSSMNSPLAGLGYAFVQTQTEYGVNDAYLAAHSFQETGSARLWGSTSIPVTKNNLFGYGAYTNSPNSAATFPSDGYAIQFQGWFIRENYLNAGAHFRYKWPTLDGMNKHYATDPNWSSDIAMYMDDLASSVKTTSANFKLYSSSNQPPSPSTEEEPVYYLSGAKGAVQSSSGTVTGYNNYEMRPELYVGAEGYWVKQMQSEYNTWLDKMHAQGKLTNLSTLTVDGQLGSMTDAALKNFQSEQNIGVDGICGPQTWSYLESASGEVHQVSIKSGTSVTVDEVRMGENLTDWYHVTEDGTSTSAWVSANDLKLSNVYRLVPSSGYEVTLTNGTQLRGGNYIVSTDGKTSVTYVNQSNPKDVQTGTLKTGSLQQVSH